MAGEKSVRLSILGNNADAKAKIAEVDAKAEELKALHPELAIGIDTAAAQAKLKVFRDEITEAVAQADAVPLEIKVDDAKAMAKLEAIKKQAEELRLLNPTLTPKINDMEASAQLAVMRGEIGKTAAESETLGKAWGATKYAMLGVAGAVGYGVYKASGFTAEMERVHTQAGLAQDKIGSLSQGVLNLAGTVGENPDSLAEATYHVQSAMGSMGATSTQVLTAVKVASEGAKVGGADLVDVTNALGAAIASGIPGVQNYQSAMGALNATVGAGDMTMQNLAEAMGTGFLSNVKIYGATLNDVGAILATFGDNNIRGAAAGTELRMAVQALAVQASTAKPYLKELGLSVGELGKYQSIHGTVSTINLLVDKMKAAKIPATEYGNVITQLFGKKAGAGIAVLIDQYERLNSKTKAVADGANTFGNAVKANGETAQQQFDRLKSGSEALATSMGIKLLPAAIKIEGILANVVSWLTKNSTGMIGLAGVISALFVGLALKKLEDGIKGAVEGFEGLYKGGQKLVTFIGQMATKLGILKTAQEGEAVATTAAADAQKGLNLAFLTSPIGLIVIGIIAVVAAFAYLWTHSAAFRNFWKAVWHDILVVVDAVVGWVKHNWPLLLGILIGPIGMAVIIIVKHWHTITAAVSAAFDWVKRNWPLIAAIITGPIGWATLFIVKHWDQIVSGAKAMIGDVIGFFRSLPGRILSALGDLGHLLWNAGASIIHGLIGGLESAISPLKSALGFVTNLIPSFKGPPEKDAMLLRPAGRLIMGGLVDGLNDGVPGLTGQLTRTTNQIANTRVAAAVGGSNSGALQVEWVGGSGADQEFITWLKRNIRIRGGDPDVLGR